MSAWVADLEGEGEEAVGEGQQQQEQQPQREQRAQLQQHLRGLGGSSGTQQQHAGESVTLMAHAHVRGDCSMVDIKAAFSSTSGSSKPLLPLERSRAPCKPPPGGPRLP